VYYENNKRADKKKEKKFSSSKIFKILFTRVFVDKKKSIRDIKNNHQT
jgi:hypothetical protein|tara:strand:- start:264 stop:407 length:144 start_codon:yes stop_codon:yes gene_type:complete